MIINKLTASFGKLENDTLSFHEGLNVICAPNESGKSTWCAFIRAMLYGVDSSERTRSGYLPDKTRYSPWSGAVMEGTIDLTADGKDITITRTTKSKNAPMREFSAVYTGTAIQVDGLDGTNAGEMLTGVTRDVFRRSAFIEQGNVSVTDSPELEKRILTIVSTGEDSSSYSEISERLNSWQRKRRFNRKGLLPELETKASSIEEQLNEIDAGTKEAARLSRRLEASRTACAGLEKQVMESRTALRKRALAALNAGKGELDAAAGDYDAALAELHDKRNALKEHKIYGRGGSNPAETFSEDEEALDAAEESSRKKVSFLPALVFFVAALACIALYTRLDYIWLMISAIAATAAALVFAVRYSSGRKVRNDALEQRRRILRKYSVSSREELAEAFESYLTAEEEVTLAEENELKTRERYEKARAGQSRLETAALAELDFASGDNEAAVLGRKLSSMRQDTARLSAEAAALNGRLSVLGDPLVLRSSLNYINSSIDEIEMEYEAISLASAVLKETYTELQLRFSPELGRVAGEYMSYMTDGRYSTVRIDRDFSAKAMANDETVARDAEYLSAGTLDLMYLAVRLAVCELALPKGEPCPLILDDVLVNLDEARRERVTSLLKEIAKERQVILFTCR